jgi:hypothetical protein
MFVYEFYFAHILVVSKFLSLFCGSNSHFCYRYFLLYVVKYRLFRPVVCEMVILIPLHSRMDHVTSLNKLT